MKVDREQLITQLESVEPGLSTRDIIEQSGCFVFKDGYVMTYNDEIFCRQGTELEIEGAVQSTSVLNLLRKMTEPEVDITVKDDEFFVKGKNKEAGITMQSEIMLPVDDVDVPKKWKDLPPEFGDAIERVKELTAKDASQFVANCVHITKDHIESAEEIKFTRYLINTPIKENTLVKRECIKHIPPLGVSKIAETKSWLHFQNANGLVVSCRKYEDEFFDLEAVLKKKGTSTTLPKALIQACEKAEVFSAEDGSANEVTVELRTGKLQITGRGATGWFKQRAKCEYSGPDITFNISPKLLTEIVDQYNECQVCEGLLRIESGNYLFFTVLQDANSDA